MADVLLCWWHCPACVYDWEHAMQAFTTSLTGDVSVREGLRNPWFAFKSWLPWEYGPWRCPKRLSPVLPQPRTHPKIHSNMCKCKRPIYVST